jgi:hypothetical protein
MTPTVVLQHDRRDSRFRLTDLFSVVVLFAGISWTIPSHLPLHAIGFYCLWTLVIVANTYLVRSCRPELTGDQLRETAYDLTYAAGAISALTWVCVAITLGILRFWTPIDVAKLLVIPIGLWFPVCLIANSLSLLLYPSPDAPRLFLLRFVSLATSTVPFLWICVDGKS